MIVPTPALHISGGGLSHQDYPNLRSCVGTIIRRLQVERWCYGLAPCADLEIGGPLAHLFFKCSKIPGSSLRKRPPLTIELLSDCRADRMVRNPLTVFPGTKPVPSM